MSAALEAVAVADTAAAWAGAGFAVDEGGVCRIGGIEIELVGRDHGLGIVGWSWRGLPDDGGAGDLDGVPLAAPRPRSGQRRTHPNGVVAVDHVVLLSPDLERTVAAFEDLGVRPRRERDGEMGGLPVRQIFFRLGEVILEVVGSPRTSNEGPSTLWGITFVVADIDLAAAYFGERTSPVKDAVQPGRRITTLRNRAFDISVRTALISPHPGRRHGPADGSGGSGDSGG